MNCFIDKEKMRAIKEVQMQIYYYNNAIRTTVCPINRLNLENALTYKIDYLLYLTEDLYRDIEVNYLPEMIRQTKEFTIDTLSTFNGSEGKPAYVAVDGIVYDVSLEKTWGGASHFGLTAGKDLTIQFSSCHGMKTILTKLTMVGVLK
jgi:predicted heme/steroid binding protein